MYLFFRDLAIILIAAKFFGLIARKLKAPQVVGEIIAGLLIGKPLGISLFCWLALRLKLAHLPEGTTYQQIMAVGILCGIGFTMSIFIASLAFGSVDPELINWAKLGILVGSISSAVIGYSWLRVRLRPSV